MQPNAATYRWEGHFLSFDLSRFESNFRSLLAQVQELLSDAPDTVEWETVRDDDHYSGEESLEDLENAFAAIRSGGERWTLTISKVWITPRHGFRRPPEEWISVSVDSRSRLLRFEAVTRGKRRAEAAFGLLTRDITLIDVELPSHLQRLEPSLNRFLTDHPDTRRNVFLMMRFREERALMSVVGAVRSACASFGLTALRADEKEYTPDLLDNVLTYLFGCHSAIAVFDQINYREFNPNVALEVGFVLSLGKPLLILKDQAIEHLPSDLVGRIYRPFNTYDPEGTIQPRVRDWVESYDLGVKST